MHECPRCGFVCDCDSDDVWHERVARCACDCDCKHADLYDDDFDDDDFDPDAESPDEADPQMPGWIP